MVVCDCAGSRELGPLDTATGLLETGTRAASTGETEIGPDL